MISTAGYICFASASRHVGRKRALFQLGMTMEKSAECPGLRAEISDCDCVLNSPRIAYPSLLFATNASTAARQGRSVSPTCRAARLARLVYTGGTDGRAHW